MELLIQSLISLAGFVGTICAIAFGLKNNSRTTTKDIEERASTNARICIRLDDLSSDVKTIKEDNSFVRSEIADLKSTTKENYSELKFRIEATESGLRETNRDIEKLDDETKKSLESVRTTIGNMQEDSKNFVRKQ